MDYAPGTILEWDAEGNPTPPAERAAFTYVDPFMPPDAFLPPIAEPKPPRVKGLLRRWSPDRWSRIMQPVAGELMALGAVYARLEYGANDGPAGERYTGTGPINITQIVQHWFRLTGEVLDTDGPGVDHTINWDGSRGGRDPEVNRREFGASVSKRVTILDKDENDITDALVQRTAEGTRLMTLLFERLVYSGARLGVTRLELLA